MAMFNNYIKLPEDNPLCTDIGRYYDYLQIFFVDLYVHIQYGGFHMRRYDMKLYDIPSSIQTGLAGTSMKNGDLMVL